MSLIVTLSTLCIFLIEGIIDICKNFRHLSIWLSLSFNWTDSGCQNFDVCEPKRSNKTSKSLAEFDHLAADDSRSENEESVSFVLRNEDFNWHLQLSRSSSLNWKDIVLNHWGNHCALNVPNFGGSLVHHEKIGCYVWRHTSRSGWQNQSRSLKDTCCVVGSKYRNELHFQFSIY